MADVIESIGLKLEFRRSFLMHLILHEFHGWIAAKVNSFRGSKYLPKI